MRRVKIVRRVALASAMVAVAGGVVVAQATGDPAAEGPKQTRAEALLERTGLELSGTQHDVREIHLEQVVAGREVYSLTGRATACLLFAGEKQPVGKSEGLACTNTETATPDRPLRTGFATGVGAGYVDLVWVGENLPSRVDTEGGPVDVRLGDRVVIAARSDRSSGVRISWTSPAGGDVAIALPRADPQGPQ